MKAGWKTATLGELGSIFNGNSISETDKNAHFRRVSKGIVYLGTKDVGFDHQINYETDVKIPASKANGFKLAPADTVFVCAEGGSAGRKIAITDREVFFGNKLYAISPMEGLSNKFVFYYCLTEQFAKSFKGAMAGLIGGVSLNKFKSLPIVLPPLPEQQRIIAILDEAFVGLATATTNAEKNLKNARELFDSHLNSVFAAEGDGRVQRILSDLCNEMTVGHVGPMATRYKPTGTPFLRSQNIRPFEINLDEVVFIDDEFHQLLAKSRLRPGDVAIVRTGYPGTAAVIPGTLKDANCADLVIVRPGDQIAPEYIAAFFNSSYGKRLVNGAAVGAAQKHFNVTAAKAVKISLPTKDEQHRLVKGISARRDECRRLEATYQKKLVHLHALRQSILERAFSGDLTSPPSQAVKEAAE